MREQSKRNIPYPVGENDISVQTGQIGCGYGWRVDHGTGRQNETGFELACLYFKIAEVTDFSRLPAHYHLQGEDSTHHPQHLPLYRERFDCHRSHYSHSPSHESIIMSVPEEQVSHLLTPSAIAGYVCWQCHVIDEDGLDATRPLKRCKGCRRAVYASLPCNGFSSPCRCNISAQLVRRNDTAVVLD